MMRNLLCHMDSPTLAPGLGAARRSLLAAVAAIMPLWPDGLPALLVAMLLLMLPWGHAHALRNRPFGAGAWQGPLPWFLMWYLWHVLGMAWSTDIGHGLFDLEVKLIFVVLPFMVLWSPEAWERHRAMVLRVFVAATALTLFFLMVRSTVLFVHELQWRATGNFPVGLPYTNIFFSSYFSPWLHPSYLAMYGVFALHVSVLQGGGRGRLEQYVLPIVLVLGVLLCASKTGWLGLLLVLVLWSRWKEPRVRRMALLSAAVATLVLAVLVASFGTVRVKFTDTWHALTATNTTGEDSSSSRVLVWRSAMELIAAQPLAGTGTGDVKNELVRVYGQRGYLYPLERRLNAHSQFLQTAVALGVPAMLLLLASLLVPLVRALRRRHHLMTALLLLSLLNWSVESMLEVQAGVVFFAFFAALLTPPRPSSAPA
jgi:O-antigen ligase